MNISETLQSLDFNPTEIKIYLSILTLGTNTASVIGKRAEINRSTAQYTCQKLTKMGLLTMSQKNNIFLFTPEPPEKLLTLLECEKNDINQKQDRVKKILNDLKGLANPHSILPKVRFFEGFEGVKNAYFQILKDLDSENEIVGYVNILDHIESKYKTRSSFLFNFIDQRVENKIRLRTLAPDTKSSRMLQQNDLQALRETRIIDHKDTHLDGTEIFIYDDKIFSMTFEKNIPFAYIVQNKNIAQIQKNIFEIAWNNTPSAL